MSEKIFISGIQKSSEYVYIRTPYPLKERLWEYEDKLRKREEIGEVEEIFHDGIIRLKVTGDVSEIFEFTDYLKSNSNLYLVREKVNLHEDKLISIKPKNPLVYGKIIKKLSETLDEEIHISVCGRPKIIKQNESIPIIHINPDFEEWDYKNYTKNNYEGEMFKNLEREAKKDELPDLIEKINNEFRDEVPPIYVTDGKVLMVILLHNNEIRIAAENYNYIKEKLTE